MLQIRGLPTLQRGQIIHRSTIHKLASAENAIETARHAANEIINQAHKDAGDIRRLAQQQGLLEGITVFNEAGRYFDDMRASLKSQVLVLLQQCLGQLLSKIPREVMIELILETAMQTIYAINPKLTLHVAPENFKHAKLAIYNWRKKSNNSAKIDVETAADLQSSECRLYAGDDVLETSLKIIADGLISAFSDGSTLNYNDD